METWAIKRREAEASQLSGDGIFDSIKDDAVPINRYIASQSYDLILKIMGLLSSAFDGEPTSALVFMAILRGNVQHLNVANVPISLI